MEPDKIKRVRGRYITSEIFRPIADRITTKDEAALASAIKDKIEEDPDRMSGQRMREGASAGGATTSKSYDEQRRSVRALALEYLDAHGDDSGWSDSRIATAICNKLGKEGLSNNTTRQMIGRLRKEYDS